MSNMTEGDTVYEVKFQIKTSKLVGKLNGFIAKEAQIEQFNPTRAYKDRNEAIDAVIQRLEDLRD